MRSRGHRRPRLRLLRPPACPGQRVVRRSRAASAAECEPWAPVALPPRRSFFRAALAPTPPGRQARHACGCRRARSWMREGGGEVKLGRMRAATPPALRAVCGPVRGSIPLWPLKSIHVRRSEFGAESVDSGDVGQVWREIVRFCCGYQPIIDRCRPKVFGEVGQTLWRNRPML